MRLSSVSSVLPLFSFINALPASQEISPRAATSPTSRSVVYIQTFHTSSGGQLSLLPLIQQHTRVNHVYLAALHVNSQPGDINLNDNSPNDTIYDTVWEQAAQLQQSGVKVMMMLGGAAPGSYPRLCSGSNGSVNESFYQPLLSTLKYHKVDGLDLDIEEKVPLSCPLNLLRRLNADLGPSFLLTMAPVASDLQPIEQGLGGFSYSALDQQATTNQKASGKLIDWFNAQFYNGWGDASSPVGYNAIVANGYSPGRVMLGVLSNPDDGGSGHYDYTVYQRTLNTLRSTYANFGSSVGWEYYNAGEKDSPVLQNYQWVSDVPSFSGQGKSTAIANLTSAPIPHPSVPWPLNLSKLLDAGVPFFEGVKALNQSNGNLAEAAQSLGLSDLVKKLLGAVGGLLGGSS